MVSAAVATAESCVTECCPSSSGTSDGMLSWPLFQGTHPTFQDFLFSVSPTLSFGSKSKTRVAFIIEKW